MCKFDHRKLGCDPTVTRLVGTSKDGSRYVFYQYKIDGRTFHTIGNPIYDLSAYHLVSRATRVWEIVEVDGEDGTRLVLKDVWLHEDAKLEKEILHDVFSKLAELDNDNKRKGAPTTYAEDAKPFFLTILEDWVVKNGQDEEDTLHCPSDIPRPSGPTLNKGPPPQVRKDEAPRMPIEVKARPCLTHMNLISAVFVDENMHADSSRKFARAYTNLTTCWFSSSA
ncbi:hypothetical protein PM082_017592 [Marasmius tenuissimus]|nr:hypothetical protein PM082_017592 [Marasmius tenuissimus]